MMKKRRRRAMKMQKRWMKSIRMLKKRRTRWIIRGQRTRRKKIR
jgi:hypothetical protein